MLHCAKGSTQTGFTSGFFGGGGVGAASAATSSIVVRSLPPVSSALTPGGPLPRDVLQRLAGGHLGHVAREHRHGQHERRVLLAERALAQVVADPGRRHPARRVADEPGVHGRARRAGLAGGRQARWLRIAGAWPRVTTWRSSVDVSHAVRGGMTGFGRRSPASATRRSSRSAGVPNGSPSAVWSSMTDAVAIADAADVDRVDEHAVARERRERARQLVDARARRAERQRLVGDDRRRDAEPPRPGLDVLAAHQLEQLHRRARSSTRSARTRA